MAFKKNRNLKAYEQAEYGYKLEQARKEVDMPDEDAQKILPDLISGDIDALVENGWTMKLIRMIMECLNKMK